MPRQVRGTGTGSGPSQPRPLTDWELEELERGRRLFGEEPEPKVEPVQPVPDPFPQPKPSQARPEKKPEPEQVIEQPQQKPKRPLVLMPLAWFVREAGGVLVALEKRDYRWAGRQVFMALLALALVLLTCLALLMWLDLRLSLFLFLKLPWLLIRRIARRKRNVATVTVKVKTRRPHRQHGRGHPFMLMHILRQFGHLGGHHSHKR